MCSPSYIVFAAINLSRQEISSKRVLEVGSRDENGSLRPIIQGWEPSEYVGVDVATGPGVDVICRAEELAGYFSADSFDVVISTELLEHIRDWRQAVSNIKRVCKPNGIILITTRSIGFRYHGYPHDFWRYEPEDMEQIFSDCEILALEKDEKENGTYIKIRKKEDLIEADLSHHELYSPVSGRRMKEISNMDFIRPGLVPMIIKDQLYKCIMKTGQSVLRIFER